MHAIWSGLITFGLVNIPVALYSGFEEREIKLELLHKKDLSPIKYVRYCQEDGKEVPYQDIVRGYQYEKGDYVVLDENDFKKLNPRLSQTIEVFLFADPSEIDTMLYEKPYFLEPTKSGQKIYALFREALKKSGKVGVARFMMKTKEYLGVLCIEDDLIVLNQLRYAHTLRNRKELALPEKNKSTPGEAKLADQLIRQLGGHFKPEKYKDPYAESIYAIVRQKIKGKKVYHLDKEPITATKAPDLLVKLQESLELAHAGN